MLACGSSSGGGGEKPTATSAAPAAAEDDATMSGSARESPWSIQYADGAANVYRFEQGSAGGEVSFEYVPVTPEMSSTGSYSGGAPHQARLAAGDARVAELWRRVETIEADTASHTDARAKGTGAFRIATPSGTREFIVEQGAVLAEIHRFMAGFLE